MTSNRQQQAAQAFARRWEGKGYEKGDTQRFWLELLQEVMGVQDVFRYIEFEDQVLVEQTNFMDGYIPATRVLIEQKSIEKDLGKPVRQSDGSLLNPFQQAKKYIIGLPVSRHPRWIVTCNFREFWIYDMEQPNGEPQKIVLANLGKEYYRLQFLVDEKSEHLLHEMEVSVKAGELVGLIYDKLLEQYRSASVPTRENKGTHSSPSAAGKLGTRSSSPASALGTQVSSPAVSSEGLPSLTQKDTVKDGNPSLLPNADILRSLNILCVRLVFCLYAEDAGLFHSKTAFHDYLSNYKASQIRSALIRLFEVLDTPLQDRDPYLDEDLAAFPYVNGGLFGHRSADGSSARIVANTSERSEYATLGNVAHYTAGGTPAPQAIIIPQFTEELKQLLLEKASADFDWSEISPTIFGAVFESTLNPETRRSGGMHYTSIENIHKVIDPLFMNDLRAEYESIAGTHSSPSAALGARSSSPASDRSQQVRTGTSALQVRQRLQAFQDKLASLTFFDPACGSGNFLTETYLSLRRLENEVIQAMYGGANILTFDTLIKVNISQFYGIEINDFACTVAKTALWIAENQMMQQTSAIAGKPMDFLPLKTNANIHEGNALRMDWASLFEDKHELPQINHELNQQLSYNSCAIHDNSCANKNSTSCSTRYPDYIIGNPPFVGARLMSKEQKDDLLAIFGKKWKNLGNMDYVCGWYLKTAQLMAAAKGTHSSSSATADTLSTASGDACVPNTRAALVSTNSITQGEQVANLWKPLFEQYGIQIDFAYRTFRWDSEADIKAHVHCVIVGFSRSASVPTRDKGTHSSPSAALGTAVAKLSSPAENTAADYRDSIGIAKGYTRTPLGTRESSPAETQYIAGGTPASQATKRIYLSDNQTITATNINAYLMDAPNIWIESRTKPLCDVPEMVFGSMANDGGNLILSADEREEYIKKYPQIEPYIKPFLGAEEFINRKLRYCLWLVACPPSVLRSCPAIVERVEKVKILRAGSSRPGTRKMADFPMLFGENRQPDGNYLLVPRVSSERRRYVPMGFLDKDTVASDAVQIIPNATLYHFGVLTSNVHMAWMRVVCGRLKSDYRYSKDIVYNNFPWPSWDILGTRVSPPAESAATGTVASQAIAAGGTPASQVARITETAQAILDARALYPDSSLADLYDEVTMPSELRKAHQENDRAVMAAYGFSPKMTETECVAELFKMYQELTKNI